MKVMKYIPTQCYCASLICLLLMMASNVYADKYDKEFEKNKRNHHLQVKDSLYLYTFIATAKLEGKADIQKDYTWYYNNSLHTTRGNYSGKLLNGDFIKYYSYTHGMAEKGTFKEGLKVGPWYTWAEDGSILTYTEYKKGKCNGKYKEYADSSKLIKEGRFKNDLKSGTWYNYSPKGDLQQLSSYKKDKKNGKYIEYVDGRKVLKGKYKNSQKKGFWKTYGKTGKLLSLTQYKNGDKNGLCIEKDSLGQKERVCWYKKGKLNGKCKKYKDGKVISVEKYKDGKLVPEKKKEEKVAPKKDNGKKEKTKKEKTKQNKN